MFTLDEKIIISSASFIVISELLKKKKKKQQLFRRYNIRNRERNYNNQLQDMHLYNFEPFHHFCKMSVADFNILLNLIGHKIAKSNTKFRDAIPVEDRLAVTLSFLSTGVSYSHLMQNFQISKQLICKIVPEVCKTITEALKDYIKLPDTREKWLQVAFSFEEEWRFPLCLGLIDGKVCLVQPPNNRGSSCSSSSNVVLLGLVDADYCFLYVDAAIEDEILPESLYRNSSFCKTLEKSLLKVPANIALPGREKEVPYMILANNAFPSENYLLMPYTEQKSENNASIFNHRLKRAYQVVENTFGVISSTFRILQKPILLEHERAVLVILACLYLHNFLRKSNSSRNIYTPPGTFDVEEEDQLTLGKWREVNEGTSLLSPLMNIAAAEVPTQTYEDIRHEFSEYFSTVDRF